MRFHWGALIIAFGISGCVPELSQTDTLGTTAERKIEGNPTKTIETIWGEREVFDPTQIPKDMPLIFDESLNRAYDYFATLKKCETEVEQDGCLNNIKVAYSDLWGNDALPRNRFSKYRFTHPLIPNYQSSAFKWKITLHGHLDEFALYSTPLFPSDIGDDLLTLYINHHEQNNGIQRLSSGNIFKPKYKTASKEALRKNFPEFNRAEYLPKKYASSSIVSGHEFTMLSGKNSLIHGVWNTHYSAIGCRRSESFFYKVNIEYNSEWLKGYLGGRNVANIHVCAVSFQESRFTIFKLDFSEP